MATLYSTIYDLFRTLIGDAAVYAEDTLEGDGTTLTFALTEDNVVVADSKVDAVYINGVLTTAYTIDAARGWITFTAAPADGATIIVQYRYYKSFSDAELKNYLQLSVGRLNIAGYSDWTVDATSISETLLIKDIYLVCAVAGVIINPAARVSWQTGELHYSSQQTGRSGDELIKDLILQAKLTGAVCHDIIVEISGIGNIYNILDEQRENESDI